MKSRFQGSGLSRSAITWVIHGTWAEDMEPHSALAVDLLDEALEQLGSVVLAVSDGVVSLAAQDGEELRAGLEEPTALADRLEGAVEPDRPGAVTIPQETPVLGGDAAHVGALDAGRERLAALIARLDGLGHPEVLLGDGPVRDAGIGQRHAHGAVTEQGGDGLEAHAPVDHPGGKGVAELMGMDVADAGTLGHPIDVAMDGPPVKGLAVVTLDQAPGAARPPELLVVSDQSTSPGTIGT